MERKMLKLITFQNPLFSPNKFKNHVAKEYSGQIIPSQAHDVVPEAEEEPTSPKISCMGQIKHKNKQRKNTKLREGQKAKEPSLRGFFVKPQEKRFCVPRPHHKVPERASRRTDLGHMRRYASAHNALTGFDWRAQGMIHAPSNEDNEGENKVIIPFSAPITIGELGGCAKVSMELKPKKEINLWKRRTMAQPRPLQVAPLVR